MWAGGCVFFSFGVFTGDLLMGVFFWFLLLCFVCLWGWFLGVLVGGR